MGLYSIRNVNTRVTAHLLKAFTALKARSDGLRKMHLTSLLFTQCKKRILSTAFYAANYAGLNKPLANAMTPATIITAYKHILNPQSHICGCNEVVNYHGPSPSQKEVSITQGYFYIYSTLLICSVYLRILWTLLAKV